MSADFYESHGIPICPNGDKLRSDEEGLFCLIEGERVAAQLVNGQVVCSVGSGKKKKPPVSSDSEAVKSEA